MLDPRSLVKLCHNCTAKPRKKVEQTLATELRTTPASLAIDIWTDRVTRSYLGINAHTATLNAHSTTSIDLVCLLLKFQQFMGKHKKGRIATLLHEVLSETPGLQENVNVTVTDNAANM